ncbi:L-histidine N(alpha)-methyltransferase [Actinoplanes sp. NPDC051633]|uniref:L-histidine N(alpha)-methyltransferase n=1 Tax=Actinoplanes sp. NPDC051633 TaxID=3155670 RepID=UPI00341DBEEF
MPTTPPHWISSENPPAAAIDLSMVRRQLEAGFLSGKYGYHFPAGAAQSCRPDILDYDTSEAAAIRALIARRCSYSGVVELGPGDGRRAARLIATARRWLPSSYLGLDCSATLLDDARRRLEDIGVSARTGLWDFEQRPTALIRDTRQRDRIVCLFLGNTLGNVESTSDVLSNIRSSLDPGDHLVISVARWKPEMPAEQHVDCYLVDGFRTAALAPLLAIGLVAEMDLSMSVEGRIIIGHATIVSIDHVPPSLADVLVPGRRLRCFISRRFDVTALDSALKEAGFDVDSTFAASESISAIATVR